MDAHPKPARTTMRSWRPRWPVAAAAATCALVLAACGSSASKPSSGTGSYNADVKIALVLACLIVQKGATPLALCF